MAAAPPQFPFYVADFLLGTMNFSLELKGAYLTCLLYQWGNDGVPGDDLKALAAVLGVHHHKASVLWGGIRTKFRRGNEGLYRNARLEAERAKQLAFSALQSTKGLAGARKRWAGSDGRGYSRGNGPDMAYQVRTSVQQSPSDPRSDPNTCVPG